MESTVIPNRYDKPCKVCQVEVPAGAGIVVKTSWTDKQTGEAVEAWLTYHKTCKEKKDAAFKAAGSKPAGATGGKSFPKTPSEGWDEGLVNKFRGTCSSCDKQMNPGDGFYRYRRVLCFDCDTTEYASVRPKKDQEAIVAAVAMTPVSAPQASTIVNGFDPNNDDLDSIPF